jgi:tetratricopeptide (TPR) repeat protein
VAEAKPGTRLAELEARWRQEPKSTAFFPLAEELRRSGKLERAIEILEQGLAVHPNYLAARVALGRNLLEAGETVAAVEVLERALAADPTQLVATKLLIEAHLQLNNLESARGYLEKYRLLVGRDQEVEAFEARLQEGSISVEARSEEVAEPAFPSSEERASEPLAPMGFEPLATVAGGSVESDRPEIAPFGAVWMAPLPPFEFDPQPFRSRREAWPFGVLGVPQQWRERWFAFAAQEGLFPVAAMAPGAKIAGTRFEPLLSSSGGAATVSTFPSPPGVEALTFGVQPESWEPEPVEFPSELEVAPGPAESAAPGPVLKVGRSLDVQPEAPSILFQPQEIARSVEEEEGVEGPALALAAGEPEKEVAESDWLRVSGEKVSEGFTAAEALEVVAIEAVPPLEPLPPLPPGFQKEPLAKAFPAEEAPSPQERPSWVLGKLYLEQGHLEDAEREFRRVLEERPDHPEAVKGLAVVAARRSGTEVKPTVSTTEKRLRALRAYLARIQRFKEVTRVP